MINFILIGLFGIYILFIHLGENALQTYLNSKYIPFVIIMSISAIAISLLGLWLNRGLITKNLSNEIESFLILIVIVILGKLFSPIFFLFGIMIFLTPNSFKIFNRKNSWKHLLIFIFIIFGFIIPTPGISSFTASQRFQPGKNVQIFSDKNIADSFGRSTNDYSIGDWVSSLNFNTDYNFYIEKDVNVVGFVFKPMILPKDYFMVSRFVIRCCAADATPVGLIVKLNDWEENYAENDWIKVEGKFMVEDFNNQKNLIVEPNQVFKAEKPTDIYIY